MRKPELVEKVAIKTQMPKTNVSTILDGIVEEVIAALKEGDEVQLIGFGTFKLTERAEREARNPITGDKVVVPAHKAPKFKFSEKVSKSFRE